MDLLGAYGSDSEDDEGSASKRAKVAEQPDFTPWDSWGYYPQVQPDGETYVISVPIQGDHVGRVIGKGGVRIKKLKAETGAKCLVEKAAAGSSWSMVTVTGTHDALLAAQKLINEFLAVESSIPLELEEMKKHPAYKTEVCKAWLNNPKGGCKHQDDPSLCFWAHGLKDEKKKPRDKKAKKGDSKDGQRPKDVLYDWRTVDKTLHGWDNGGMVGTDGQYK